MTEKAKEKAKNILVVILFIVALGIAGSLDYQEARYSEAQNSAVSK